MHIYFAGSAAFAILFDGTFDMRLYESAFFAYGKSRKPPRWFYMRFYMVRELTEAPGDQSRNFAFLAFFPRSLRDLLDPFVSAVHSYAVALGVVPETGSAATGTMLDKSNLYERKKYRLSHSTKHRAIHNMDVETEALMSSEPADKEPQPSAPQEVQISVASPPETKPVVEPSANSKNETVPTAKPEESKTPVVAATIPSTQPQQEQQQSSTPALGPAQ